MTEEMKKLKEAQETMCIFTGVLYETILKIQEDFKRSGIEANITTGGLQVYAAHHNKIVKKICLKYDTTPQPGVSRYEENVALNVKKTRFPTIENP